MKLLLTGALCAALLVGCGTATPTPTPTATPTDRPASPDHADEPAADTHLDPIESPAARNALGAWIDASGHAWRVVSADGFVNATSAVIVREARDDLGCRLVFAKVDVSHDDPDDVTSEGDIGSDCCPGDTCDRSGTDWMVHLWRANAASDHDALAALIDPVAGLTVALEWVADDELDTKVVTVTAADVADDGLPDLSVPDPQFVSFSCDDVEGTTMECVAGAGGLHQTWHWRLDDDAAYLFKVEESGH